MMRVIRSLTLMKHSTIHTIATAPNQCKDVGHGSYDYEIEITTNDDLDGDGFIIDHSVIHDVIKNVIQNKMGSCEQLCLRVEEDVIATLRKHGATVQSLKFAIKPVNSNAWIRVEGEYAEIKQRKYEKLS